MPQQDKILEHKKHSNGASQYIESADFNKDKRFWETKFSTLPEKVVIQFDNKGSLKREIGHTAFCLSEEMSIKARSFTASAKCSIHELLISVVYIYLSRISGYEELTIGTNFNTAKDSLQILPLKINNIQTDSFTNLIKNIEQEITEITSHQHDRYPASLLNNYLKEKFQEEAYNLTNITVLKSDYPDKKIEFHSYLFNNNNNDLTLLTSTENETIHIEFYYNKGTYTPDIIENIYNSLLTIFDDAMKSPEKALKDLEIVSTKDKQKIFYAFNKTGFEKPEGTSFQKLFEEMVKRFPNRVAAAYNGHTITYKELNEKANSLACVLRDKGVKANTAAGIMVDRSLEMIIGTIAILKAGGAYVPIETSYPQDRIQYILENSQSPLLLTQKHLSSKADYQGEIVFLDDESIYKHSIENPETASGSDDLAYIIYTSGSTGKPKGVMIEHKSLINMCYWHIHLLGLTEDDNIFKNASFGFDASVLEIFPTLLAGAAVHIIPEEIKFSPYDINEYFELNKVTGGLFTTQFGEQFMEMVDNHSLRYLLVGGEKLRTFKKLPYQLHNCYGPTEYTVYATSFPVNQQYDNIPIGKPIANTQLYVVDKHNNLLPPGIPGELCIAGDGLARGYLNRPDLTEEKFIENPFKPGTKMYKTGDLVRWLKDGNVEYLGRIDFQVKLRGFRIELGEIEQQMLKLDYIRDAVVIDRTDKNDNKYLCAYFVSDQNVDIQEMKKTISVELPYYMIPSHFVQLDSIPLTPNGKVARKQLPEPTISVESGVKYEPPTTETEEKLATIWQEILGVARVGMNDNFFVLGGHSLKAVKLQSKIEKELGVSIKLNDVFKFPTIKELAIELPGKSKAVYETVQPLHGQEYYDLTNSQKRVFFIEQLQGQGTAYNVPLAFKIKGNLDRERLASSIDFLVERHEALRTSFHLVDNEPVQRIHEKVKLKKIYRSASEEDLYSLIDEFVKPFNLTSPPLFRVELIKINDNEHILLLDFHHIIIDGTSMVTFLDELALLYAGAELPPIKYQCKDFAVWQNKLMHSELYNEQEKYWMSVFEDGIPTTNLPTDYPYPVVMDYAGNEFIINIDSKMTSAINEFANKTGTTLYMVLMTAFNIMLSRYTSSEDIVVGAPIAGRNHADMEGIVGMFVNTIPVRNFPAGNKTFREFLAEVNTQSLTAFENQLYPLDDLVDKLNIKRDSSRNPLFDVGLIVQNMGIKEETIGGITITPMDITKDIAKFDLLLEVWERTETLAFNWNYRTSIFKEETIKRFADEFTTLLNSVVKNPDQKINHINFLPKEEEYSILYDFNHTEMDYNYNRNYIEIFEEQLDAVADNIAVVFKDKKLTYKELNERSNQLARTLMAKGSGTGNIIPIMVERSLEMVIGALAILKTGNAFLPVEISYPEDRKRHLLQDCNAKLIITQESCKDTIEFSGIKLILEDNSNYDPDHSNLNLKIDPENLAFLIYTSGSTGLPKGAMIRVNSLVNFCLWFNKCFKITPADNIFKTASFGFDASVMEIFPALLAGASIHIIPEEIKLSLNEMNDYFETHHVTGGFMTTQLAEQFMDLVDNNSLRFLLAGGEKLRHFKNRNYQLYNVYGPTETTILATIFPVNKSYHNIPIGSPLGNYKMYVLNETLMVQPIGVPGELYISGPGVAEGYLNRPELTQEKFIDNPFLPGQKMYKTGDIVRWRSDGNIEYMGRSDFQVKLRGFRIEMGEIENHLREYPAIKDIIVTDKDDPAGNKYLCAYYLAEQELDSTDLKSFLSQSVPDYMIPSFFIKIEAIPLTPNGKLNKKALPEPDLEHYQAAEYIEPQTAAEIAVANCWKKVLKIEKAGLNDNFFDLGGNSLKAVSLVAELQKYYEIKVNDVFTFQTLKEMAAHVKPLKDNIKIKLQHLTELSESLLVDTTVDYLKKPAVQAEIQQYQASIDNLKQRDLTQKLNYQNILLTGVTGYLGAYLLKQLLIDTNASVYCLIRGQNEEHARTRLNEQLNYYFDTTCLESYMQKLIIINGDLSKPNLGIEEQAFQNLCEKIDCIIHPAANVKHYGRYEEFYNHNVVATENLLNFAVTSRKKDFHHVSTVGVAAGRIPEEEMALFTEDTSDIGQIQTNFYGRTKLEAEQLVLKAREKGLNTSIYRAGNITFDTTGGPLQKNVQENAFFNVLKSFVNLGIVPDMLDEYEFSYVDQVAEAIVLLFNKAALQNQTFHIQSNKHEKISSVLSSDQLDFNLDKLPFADYIKYLNEKYDKPALKPYIESTLLHYGWLENQETTEFAVKSDKTITILKQLGFEWADLPISQFNKFLLKTLDERIEFLKTVPVLANMKESEIKTIACQSKETVFEADEIILWENESNESLHIIIDGNVETYRHASSGWLGTIFVLSSGELLGEDILQDGGSVVTAQVILDDARILSIPKSNLRKMLNASPAIGFALLSALSNKLNRLEKIFVNLN
jgi:amino acid adenylation domain-containing protein/thioester reductase-like protein